METLDKVKQVVSEELSIPVDKLTLLGNLSEDYGADSYNMVMIVMYLEEDLQIKIPDIDAEKVKTIQDIVQFINGAEGVK